MRTLTITRCATLAALVACAAWAGDITGTWTAQMGGPDGDGATMSFHFKQDGTKLTGTVDGPGGNTTQISDGKIDGDKISFTLKMERGDGEAMKITHEGTISGDQITLTMKMEGGRGGGPDGGPGAGGPPPDGGNGGGGGGRGPGGPGGSITLKRAK